MDPTPEERAEDVYAEWLERYPDPGEGELRTLCERHPELASVLRELHQAQALMRAITPNEHVVRGLSATGGRPRLDGFEILERLGRGGMGEVWEARETALNRRVALKWAPWSVSSGSVEQERAHREALACARLKHPHVVTLYRSTEQDGRLYLVYELVEGGRTLRDEIEEWRRGARLPADHDRRVASTLVAVADALQHAHSCGIVHRDVKPQNILIDSSGRPKLADFGLSRSVSDVSLSVTGAFIGTYPYASPEQVRGERQALGPASDMFSLGATLYECLTLERPFAGASPEAVTRSILDGEPRDPRAVRPGTSRDLALVCLRAMEMAPSERYRDMASFRDDLQRFLDGEPVHARPVPAWRRARRWVVRHRALSISAAVVLAALVVVTAALWRVRRSESDLVQANQDLNESNKRLIASEQGSRLEAESNRQLADFLVALLETGDPYFFGGGLPSIEQIIDTGSERLRQPGVLSPRMRARMLGLFGHLQLSRGDWRKAEDLLLEAQRLGPSLDQSTPYEDVERSLGIAAVQFDLGRRREAERILKSTYEAAGAFEESDPELQNKVRAEYGFVLERTGQYAKGEALLREALDAMAGQEGGGSFGLSDSTGKRANRSFVAAALCEALLLQGKLDECGRLLDPLFAELEPLVDSGNPYALNALDLKAKYLVARNEPAEAMKLLERGYESVKAHLGPDHPRSWTCITNMSVLWNQAGQYDRAEDALLDVIDRAESRYGRSCMQSLMAKVNLSTSWTGMKRYVDTEDLLREVVQDAEDLCEPTDSLLLQAKMSLGFVIFRQERFAEAADILAAVYTLLPEPSSDRTNLKVLLDFAVARSSTPAEQE